MSDVTITGVQRTTQSDMPGTFTLKNMHLDRARISFSNVPDGWFVKNVWYGDQDLWVTSGRFTFTKLATPVRVVLDPNGARVKVKVTNDKGEPVMGKRVLLVKQGLGSPQKLVGQLWLSYSDQNGECSSFTLVNEPPRAVMAPGDYTVLAADMPYNQTADVLDSVWQAIQSSGTRITLRPGQTADVSVKPVTLR
jgi:hypothetical protein